MPISIKKLLTNTSVATFGEGENAAHITYYPARINETIFARLEALSSKESGKKIDEQFADINETLVFLIKEWDIYEDEEAGVLFPLDAKKLKEMPPVLRMAIIGAIMEDFRPEALMAPQTQN
jgi:hypothetical protein